MNAQTNFPSKPVRLVVGFPPGGANDVLARLIGARMAALGIDPVGNTPEQLGAILKADLEKWTGVAKSAGVKAE